MPNFSATRENEDDMYGQCVTCVPCVLSKIRVHWRVWLILPILLAHFCRQGKITNLSIGRWRASFPLFVVVPI